jgi:zinc transport system substrate-binding protein
MKRLTIIQIVFYSIILIILCSCSEKKVKDSRIFVGVTTSYLECAVRDLAGDSFEYVRIAPPGMCPGHFDLKPGLVKDLQKSSALFRFDFQESLDEKVSSWNLGSLSIHPIKAPEGLCVPDSYRSCLKEIYQALCKSFPDRTPLFKSNLEQALLRLDELEKECRKVIQDLKISGLKVVASGHQVYFCRWLEMEVVATFSGGGDASPNDLKNILDKGRESGIRYIIGNLQEGRQQAEAFSNHLDAPLVIFSNFPDMSSGQSSFIDLVKCNIEELRNAMQRQ